MSSRIDLRSSRSLELLKSLEQTVSEFARKEDHLQRDMKARRFAAERKCHDGVEKADEKLAALVATADAEKEKRERAVRATHAARVAKIKKFNHSGMRDLPHLAQEARERWLGTLQMRKFKAER